MDYMYCFRRKSNKKYPCLGEQGLAPNEYVPFCNIFACIYYLYTSVEQKTHKFPNRLYAMIRAKDRIN